VYKRHKFDDDGFGSMNLQMSFAVRKISLPFYE